MSRPTGFHEGELAVQERAGVRGEAARLAGMLAPPSLDGGIGRFLRQCAFAVLTARDGVGTLWASRLIGPRGMLAGHGDTLLAHARPADGDPLRDLPVGQSVGMIAMDFASRRRVRVNGTLVGVDADGLRIDVDQAFGNCPRYIHERDAFAPVPAVARRGTALTADDLALIHHADTFFLGTAHPGRGADASHRGGPPGFVRVTGHTLWWPDYPGNNLFNSLGNLAVDDEAALLFVDFQRGGTLQLSGTAAVVWSGDAERTIRFAIRDTVTREARVREP